MALPRQREKAAIMEFTAEVRPRGSSSKNRGIGYFLFVIALSLAFPSSTVAQANTDTKNQNEIFSPSMAVIVVVLVASVFFMVFFLVYVRQCSSLQAEGGSIRNFAGISRRAARGLDASVISTFPTFFYSEVKALKKGREALECAVCLNEFEEDEMLRLIPRCDHVFHPECIDAWLESHITCPVCRANLAPKTGDSEVQPTESTSETDVENQVVAVEEQQPVSPPHAIEDDSPVLKMLNGNRSRSPRSSRLRWFFPRSHSTGHSLVQPGENTERFTLRLPVEVRKQIMNRQLHRATSLVVLRREVSSRRGYRFGGGEGSGRGKSFRQLDRKEMSNSERWVFSVTPPFFTRMSSMKTAKVVTDGGEGTSGAESKMEV